MAAVTFGDLKIITNTELPTSNQWFNIACGNNAVTLLFGENKTLRVNSMGVWTHSLLFWQGAHDAAFSLFMETLPEGHLVYQNKDITVLYLKNDIGYGCLRVSLKLQKSGYRELNNNMNNVMARRLDELFNLYNDTKNINQCLKFWTKLPLNLDLNGVSYDTISSRREIYTGFTEPLERDPVSATMQIESILNECFNKMRAQAVRFIFSEMYELARKLKLLDGY